MSHHDDNKVVILKNTTVSDITIEGRVIPALGERDVSNIPPSTFHDDLKALLISGDLVVGDGVDDFGPKRGGSWIFGRHVSNVHFEYADSNGGSTTTATTWQQKVALNWTATDADYLIEWAAEVRVQNNTNRIGVRCRIDDSDLINSISINPSRNSGDWGPVSGFAKLTLLPGAHKIDVDFSSASAGALVRIRNARIKVTQAV